MIMSEYSWSIEYIRNLSRGQIILFCEKIAKRKRKDSIFQAKLHNAYKNPGLNTDNAIAIEDVIDKQKRQQNYISNKKTDLSN